MSKDTEETNMEEKKVFDFSTPNGKNILVYLLDEDGDDPVLLFVKKQYGMYGTFITDDSTNLFMEMFERFEVGDVTPDDYISRIEYIDKDVLDFISNETNMEDCLDDDEINHLKAVIARWKEENEVE